MNTVVKGYTRVVACAALVVVNAIVARAQLPSAPDVPWNQPVKLSLHAPPAPWTFDKTLTSTALNKTGASLATLIDLAERHNPRTRIAWEQAREAAAAKGVARSALAPVLTGLVLGQTTRGALLINSAFVQQTEGIGGPAFELGYTIFDWNGRVHGLRAARYDLYASDFSFNNVHLEVIETVATDYYALLKSQGQVTAAVANLKNAQAISAQVDARLSLGLATLPDDLEARAAAAQAAYDLAGLQGAQSKAQASLAITLGLPVATVLLVIPLEQLVPPSTLSETAADATAQALRDRPDLLQQETQVTAAMERIQQARSAFYPQLAITGFVGQARFFGAQNALPTAYTNSAEWNIHLNLSWTLFDGGRRGSDVASARAVKAVATAALEETRNQIEDEVWTAYTDTQTAFVQQQAAETVLNAAEMSYSAAVEAYQNGVRTLVDVVTAQRLLALARSEQVVARTNLFEQAMFLTFRTGELLRSHPGPALLLPGQPLPSSSLPISSEAPVSAPLIVPGAPAGSTPGAIPASVAPSTPGASTSQPPMRSGPPVPRPPQEEK